MTGDFKLHEWVMALFLLLLIWPGYRDVEPLESPKQGYWTVASVFWPLRRAYRSLWPADPALAKSMQNSFRLALTVAVAADVGSRSSPGVAEAMSRNGWEIVVAAVALLIGRGLGFWSADRRIARKLSIKGAAEVGARAQAADSP
jgi:hypothetical protein